MAAQVSTAPPRVAPDRPVFRLAQEREFYKFVSILLISFGHVLTRFISRYYHQARSPAAADNRDTARRGSVSTILASKPHTSDHRPPRRSSRDTALTAFAQLGALRLNARRCVVSLFDAHTQHVLAEATRTLSLQDDDTFDVGDALVLGCGAFPREMGVCEHVVNMVPRAQSQKEKQDESGGDGNRDGDGTALVVPDLAKDDRFTNCAFPPRPPLARFYAGVPILSPRGIAIGVYAVVDDVPRPNGLTASQLQFMKDMAATVMNHLALGRWKQRHRRGERMIAGLGSFLEYKGTIRGSVQEDDEVLAVQGSDGLEPVEGRLNVKQQEIQDHVDAMQGGGSDVYRDTLKKTPAGIANSPSRSEVTEEQKLTMNLHQKVSASPFVSKDSMVKETDTPKEEKPQDIATRMQQTFSRASNVIRESIEVEGVAFFDASVQSYTDTLQTSGGNTSDSDTAASYSEVQTAGSEDDKPAKKTDDADGEVVCDVLGFSTSTQSSINDDPTTDDRRLRIPASLLKTFLRRYPYGKIFNFNEYGAMSSGDSSDDRSSRSFEDSIHLKSRIRRKRITTRAKLNKEDAERLIQVFPGARSIAFFPLWDSHRLRWLSGCFAWTNTPMRVFAADDELTYLYAFGNSIMAEIARHDVEMADRAKVNLVSSISHELRSPLHGIVGTLELLGESGLNALQTEMVGMIGSCSRTLLDIVEHLLDFTEINNAAAANDLKRPPLKRSAGKSSSSQPANYSKLGDSRQNKLQRAIRRDLSRPTTSVRLDVVIEEVIEAVCAGQSYRLSQVTHSPSRCTITPSSGPMIVLDIQASPSWVFDTEPGAWRRIVMNLFGNALKYTTSGVITVSLGVAPVANKDNTSSSSAAVVERKKRRRRRPELQRRISSYRSGSTVPDSDSDHAGTALGLKPPEMSHPQSQSGYISRVPSRSRSRTRHPSRLVTLTVSDTGRGIQRAYLRDSLFTPFSQEDPLAPGNGLGLSIVRQAVRLLGGEIKVDSTEGVGTTVSVGVRMVEADAEAGGETDGDGDGTDTDQGGAGEGQNGEGQERVIERVVKRVSGKTLQLVGFDKDECSALRASLERVCRDWFGMQVCTVGTVSDRDEPCNFDFDFYLTTVEGKQALDADASRLNDPTRTELRPVITICDTFDAVQAMVKTKLDCTVPQITEYISQPCGPRKLAQAFDVVTTQGQLQAQLGYHAWGHEEKCSSVGYSSASTTPRFIPPAPTDVSPSVASAVSTVPLRTPLGSSRSQSYSSATQTNVTTPSPVARSLMPVFPKCSEHEHEHEYEYETKREEQPQPQPQPIEPDPEGESKVHQGEAEVKESATPEKPPDEQASPPSDSQRQQSVLLVDDNPINLKLLEALVKKHHAGYTYATATNGIEAVAAFSAAIKSTNGGFDVVLMGTSSPPSHPFSHT